MELLKKIIAIEAVKWLIICVVGLVSTVIVLAATAWGLENITYSTDLLLVAILLSIFKEEIKTFIDSFSI